MSRKAIKQTAVKNNRIHANTDYSPLNATYCLDIDSSVFPSSVVLLLYLCKSSLYISIIKVSVIGYNCTHSLRHYVPVYSLSFIFNTCSEAITPVQGSLSLC